MQATEEWRGIRVRPDFFVSSIVYTLGSLRLIDLLRLKLRLESDRGDAGHVEVRDLCRAPLVVPRQSVILCPFAIRVRDDVCEL